MARILVTGFCAVPGPHRVGVQIPHVLRALSGRHQVEVLTIRRGEQAYVEQYRRTRMLRVPVPEAPVTKQIDAFRRALRRQLEGAEYDVVHFRDGWAGVPVMELRDRLKLRTVFDVARGPMAQAPIPDEALQAALARDEQACLAAADLVLAPTEPAARYLSSRGAGDRVRLVPPGVDVDRFDWDHARPGPARIVYAGMIRRGRGIRALLRAMVEVVTRTDAHLALIGPVDPGFVDVLRRDIAKYGLSQRVWVPGAVDNERVPEELAAATICVAPMALELARQPTALYPTKLLEYMACRRVLVAPRCGTVRLVVDDGQHGVLFEPGDPTDLAAQILRLLADPALRDRLARAAYDRVRAGYTAAATRRELLAAYEPLVADLPETTDTGPRVFGPLHERDETAEVTDSQLEPVDDDARPPVRSADTDAESLFAAPAPFAPEAADDPTNVEVSMPLAERTDESPVAGASEWVVAPPGTASGAVPIDIPRTRTATALRENRFVAGELEVPSPASERVPQGAAPDEDEPVIGMFAAAAPLLGDDAPDDTGEAAPAPDPE
ncbi:MAG: glycosyltransferase family 1 protein [Deltaproteobacteria bacterium]|nr:MAG: glycosyltransferase family 1 protein [Deltaproteobacteria bacterium]